jgi:hypothetical protein
MWYLTNKGIIDQPELWIRRDSKHDLTPRGRCWEWAKGREKLTSENVRLDVVNVANKGDYIVALVYDVDQDDEDGNTGREIPMPIGRPRSSDHRKIYIYSRTKRCC